MTIPRKCYKLKKHSLQRCVLWACSAAGSAFGSHPRGRGFESLQVHHNVETKRCLLRKARIYRAFLLPKRRFFSVPKHRCKIAVFPNEVRSNSASLRYGPASPGGPTATPTSTQRPSCLTNLHFVQIPRWDCPVSRRVAARGKKRIDKPPQRW